MAVAKKAFMLFEGTRVALALVVTVLLPFVTAHLLLPWYTKWGTSDRERLESFAGDSIVTSPVTAYTLAVTIRATPSVVWPWLIQMGQGRGGFYTHQWIENLLGADIHNADRVVPELQDLAVGDTVKLTPDPYFGRPGQFMIVAEIDPEHAVVFKQTLPNGSIATWAFVVRARLDGTTRLLTRRRGGQPTAFDRVMRPGYVFMDRGMLQGLRERAEASMPATAAG